LISLTTRSWWKKLADRAKTPRRVKHSPNFAACGRAEQKKSQIFALRAAVESVALSFRTICLIFETDVNARFA
jgi:hypothetical protein